MHRHFLLLALTTLTLTLTLPAIAQDPAPPEGMPPMPKPAEQHQWLQQMVGEWTVVSTMQMGEDDEPTTSEGTETVRDLGGFWVVAECNADFMGQSYTNILTLGYDTAKQSYVGTFIGSAMDTFWTYTGTRDGNKLILETSGPCPMQGGKITPFRETMEFHGKNKRTFTSEMKTEDGTWQQIVHMEYKRKK